MTYWRAPSTRWGTFIRIGVVAAAMGASVQLGFAALAIALLGLPHGAGDLAVVPLDRRAWFLLAYGTAIGAVLVLWVSAPVIGLSVLLLCSAIHFSLDDAAGGNALTAWAIGACLVAAPAVLHRAELAALFTDITAASTVSQQIALLLQAIGLVALAVAIGATFRDQGKSSRQRGATLLLLGAVVLLPPLVGFAIGFVLLHARDQTEERRRELGCATTTDYLRRISPVMAGAMIVLVAIAIAFAGQPHAHVTTLFAAIAALAMPHMLVTPYCQRRAIATPETNESNVHAMLRPSGRPKRYGIGVAGW